MTNKLQTTVETTQEFDNFDYVKSCILKSYCKQLLAGEDTKSLEVQIKNYYKNQFVFGWLHKVGSLNVKGYTSETIVDETGKTTVVYTVKIEDFNVDAKFVTKKDTAKCKAGTTLNVFDNKTMGKALRLALV